MKISCPDRFLEKGNNPVWVGVSLRVPFAGRFKGNQTTKTTISGPGANPNFGTYPVNPCFFLLHFGLDFESCYASGVASRKGVAGLGASGNSTNPVLVPPQFLAAQKRHSILGRYPQRLPSLNKNTKHHPCNCSGVLLFAFFLRRVYCSIG